MQLSQITLGVLLLTLPACGGDGAEAPTASASLPESYFSATVNADPLDVVDLREASSVGSEVTVQGKVRDLFESAAFTLADHSLVSCADMGDDDHCKTPWDYCCEDPDALVAGTVVVEFREGERVRKEKVRGFHGLDNLSRVVVTGELTEDSVGNLSVIASSLHIEKP